jgi:hypothetical protein
MNASWLAVASLAVVSSTYAAPTPPAAKLFNDSCTACHSIGGGDLAGPDLINSARKPRGDIEQAVKRMQDNVGPLSPEQIAGLVDLLQAPDARIVVAEAANPTPAIEVPPEQKAASADTGRRLFFGEAPFANRGVPCAGCPAVKGRGGNLAVDLSTIHFRRNDAALLATAEQPAFPLMKGAYARHAVTRQEAYHLVAFLAAPPAERSDRVHGIAGGITLVVLGGVAALFRSRRAGVRSRMVHK